MAARQAEMLDQHYTEARSRCISRRSSSHVQRKITEERQGVNRKKPARKRHTRSKPKINVFCGKERHPRERCPARKATCSKCRKIDHWHQVCKTVRYVNVHNGDEGISDKEVQGFCNMVKFLIDSGADITCVPERMLSTHLLSLICKRTEVTSGPDGKKLEVIGKLKLKLIYRENEMVSDVYVLKNLQLPIHGRP